MTLRNNRGEELHLTHYSWRRALRLAERYGWRPAGTHVEDSGRWTGSYFSRAEQMVMAEDAVALAHALEVALPDVPKHDAMKNLRTRLGMLPDVVWFSGETRGMLESFIRFCHVGGFRIA
jgi:hypothetical protein